MRRLVDEPESPAVEDADGALLARLMRSVGPLPRSESARRRVMIAVREQAGPRRQPARWQAAFAALALILIAGIASATIGRGTWERWLERAPSPTVEPARQVSPTNSASGTNQVSPTNANPVAPTSSMNTVPPSGANPVSPTGSTNTVSPANANPVSPNPASPTNAANTMSPARRIAARAKSTALDSSSTSPPSAQDALGAPAALVMTAVRALRRDKDPARARVLLDDYLRENPDGPLAEDALALSIEAAASQDDPDAAVLARRYLAAWPAGRFLDVARRAVARFTK